MTPRLPDAEVEAILADEAKWIDGDIAWTEDEDHSTAVEFRADVKSDAGYPIFLYGRCNLPVRVTSFSIIHRGAGRILGLDLGKDHHNPTCEHVGDVHWQRWSEQFGSKLAEGTPQEVMALPEVAEAYLGAEVVV